ncbi:EamA family transporter [Tenuibacillus multivorans]|uniref:Drug/metabolite transporter, DME family n=1 Tax=Tenuibacillus multivorans TaxID=237069 RepID=A0A1H0B619_9BACI|nr:EamA family transporter [Tenuibacillus multivorans]GEL78630.1 putative transporter YwfM [Tenuibacillus multivorans]SDN41086.1 drug/metabolite transporter, DME family [Tenuibacillus multivorans]
MKLSVLLVLMAAILWGTTGTAQALAPTNASPLVIGALRLLIGGGTLLIYIAFQRNFTIKGIPKKALFISALAMALYQPFFFSGVHMTGVAIGTVVAICSAPIFAGLIEWLIYHRLPDWVWGLSTILAVIGCLLLFQSEESIVFDPLGVLFSLIAGLSFAIYTFVSKSLVAEHPPDVVVALVFSSAAVFLLPLLFTADLSWTLQWSGMLSVLHLGILATALSYILFARGLKGVAASTAVTLALAEPLTASILGLFLLGEKLTLLSGFGLVLLMAGLILLSNKQRFKNVRA